MRRRIITVLSLTLILMCLLASLMYVSAANPSTSIEKMSFIDCKNIMYDICTDIFRKNSADFQLKYYDYFTEGTMYDMIDLLKSDKFSTGRISEINVDFTYPENSTTKDSVVMCDLLINRDGNTLCYLVEFHLNKDGKIYGFNIWHY